MNTYMMLIQEYKLHTFHLTLMAVSLTALTVTSGGGPEGEACIVWKVRVGSLGSLCPAVFSAINLNLYTV